MHAGILKDKISILIANLLEHERLDATVWPDRDECPEAEAEIENVLDLYRFRLSNAEKRPCVTSHRVAGTKEGLADKPWEFTGTYDVTMCRSDCSSQICDKMKTLNFLVWAKEWDVNIDLQALVEKAYIEAGLERIYEDVEGWTSVPSEDAAHPNTLLLGAEMVEYDVQDDCN
ncbi:hypothetical protein CC86DRAFT_388906 [Ophiobolus disseminans]|uniref:Uncharacterized protein n=1 Tax=Ophiobolus disseminans TaxID=1469910 RepID=A0A6A6ZCI5_9PLEO|nr:hypothetical protein CC86DRAFT_388906 [Ophiobolus disseminans]